MAILTKEQKAALAADEAAALLAGDQGQTGVPLAPAPAAEAPAPKEKEADQDYLIAAEKDGETIKVHPDALAEHKRLGWIEA